MKWTAWRKLALIGLAALALALAGCGGQTSSTPCHPQAARLRLAAPKSMIVYVSDHGRAYVRTSGTPRPSATQRFRIASVTKTFTAAIILQLAAEGKLRLNDTVARYLPGVVPGGQHITIRELLGHRSGLANFTDYVDWLARADRSTSIRPIDVLRFAASQPRCFPPNGGWQYSNTNYIALGLIIERVTRQSFAQELEQRIFGPLGLRHTQLATSRTLPDLHDQGENPNLGWAMNPNLTWAAGGIVSNAPDLVRFFSALLSGRILSRGSLMQMETTRRTIGTVVCPQKPELACQIMKSLASSDGLGIFSTQLPFGCGLAWGHEGDLPGYHTIVEASQDGSRVAVFTVRGSPQPLPPDVLPRLCPGHTTKTH
jgi:D-alanyl-D-alanine carboxypeptidase